MTYSNGAQIFIRINNTFPICQVFDFCKGYVETTFCSDLCLNPLVPLMRQSFATNMINIMCRARESISYPKGYFGLALGTKYFNTN